MKCTFLHTLLCFAFISSVFVLPSFAADSPNPSPCESMSLPASGDVAGTTYSLIESMLQDERVNDAEMLYKKILLLKDDPTAGEKTATTAPDYGAKCQVRRFQQRAAQELIRYYYSKYDDGGGKVRAVYDQAHAALSSDPLSRAYLVEIAPQLFKRTKTSRESNELFQTLTLPENIPLTLENRSRYLLDDRDDQPVFDAVYNARITYLRMYQIVFRDAVREKNHPLAESLYRQSEAWRVDNHIVSIRAAVKAKLDTMNP